MRGREGVCGGGWGSGERCRGLREMKGEVDWRCFRPRRAFIERKPSNADRLSFPEIRGFYYPQSPVLRWRHPEGALSFMLQSASPPATRFTSVVADEALSTGKSTQADGGRSCVACTAPPGRFVPRGAA